MNDNFRIFLSDEGSASIIFILTNQQLNCLSVHTFFKQFYKNYIPKIVTQNRKKKIIEKTKKSF